MALCGHNGDRTNAISCHISLHASDTIENLGKKRHELHAQLFRE